MPTRNQCVDSGLGSLVYVVRREGLGPVFLSQVVWPMSRLAQAGMDVRVVVLCPLGQLVKRSLRARWQKTLDAVPEPLRGRVHRLASGPSRVDWPWLERFLLVQFLKRYLPRDQRLIVQCRNARATAMVLEIRRRLADLRVVYDCRGVEDEEFLYERRGTLGADGRELTEKAAHLSAIQRRAACQSDAMICVSQAMVAYLVEQHGIDEAKCTVIPCCVDLDHFADAAAGRDTIREQLGLADRFVVAYCGSLSSWQLPDESLDVFQQIALIEPRAHFLAITTQPDRMRTLIAQRAIPDHQATVTSVPHRHVARYLAAADCGLLLRETSPVNQVASPVKFGEYLASGTPVIITPGVGDYSELAEKENVGLVLPLRGSDDEGFKGKLREFVASYQADPLAWRLSCNRIAATHLDSCRYLPTMLARYAMLQAIKTPAVG